MLKKLLIATILISLFLCCNPSMGNEKTSVTIQKMEPYYRVNIDLTDTSHKEMGMEYALKIKNINEDYEKLLDNYIKTMVGIEHISFETVKNRALDIKKNLPQEYIDEIDGMAAVFNCTEDVQGDGRLSQNELLVLQVYADVLRPCQCSASAVFGSASSTGKTIVGRNLDWYETQGNEVPDLYAVTIIKNGDKSLTTVGILGILFSISSISSDKIFGALLDGDTGEPYPDTKDKRSYPFDLRYALENKSTLQEVADFLKDKNYAFNHIIFLADENTAKVLEENINSPSRGLRSSNSELRNNEVWSFTDTVATVNSFLLPGNFDNHIDSPSNTKRWESYKKVYKEHTASGKIDVEAMKEIAGYTSTDGNGRLSGAIFRSSDGFPTIQSIILRMDTGEMWVAFCPPGKPPLNPTYIKIFSGYPYN